MKTYEDRIPYTGKDAKTLHRPDDLTVARKMFDKGFNSGEVGDFELAALLFEKCGHYDEAARCRNLIAELS